MRVLLLKESKMFKDLNPPDPILDHNDPRLTAPRNSFGKAKNLFKATARVVEAISRGDQLFVKTEEWKRRSDICNACELWKPSGNLRMGECTHEKCGCTKLKRGLATERCPLNKWEITEIY